MATAVKGETGTLAYEWDLSDDGTNCVTYERFSDSAAALAHLAGLPTHGILGDDVRVSVSSATSRSQTQSARVSGLLLSGALCVDRPAA